MRAGALVAFPTETVYGLGGDATNERAVAAIFAAKARPAFNPLAGLCSVTTHFGEGIAQFISQFQSVRPENNMLLPGVRALAVRISSAADPSF